jgi:hypothetical protein
MSSPVKITRDLRIIAGLQRAVANYLAQRVVREPVGGAETGTVNRAAFNAILRRDYGSAPGLFAGADSDVDSLSADLQRASMPLPKGQAVIPQGAAADKL